MNKYFVKMVHIFSTLAEVEAEDKDGAIEAAERWFVDTESEKDTKLYYEATMDKKNWAVLTKEEYQELREKIQKELEAQENTNNIIAPNIITP